MNVKEFCKKHRVLILSLKEPWFSLMESGEKTEEIRRPSKWIKSRLFDAKKDKQKEYDYILFINGYGSLRPWFICKYEGYGTGYDITYTFSNNMQLLVKPEYYVIFLGEIVHRGNIIEKTAQLLLM